MVRDHHNHHHKMYIQFYMKEIIKLYIYKGDDKKCGILYIFGGIKPQRFILYELYMNILEAFGGIINQINI